MIGDDDRGRRADNARQAKDRQQTEDEEVYRSREAISHIGVSLGRPAMGQGIIQRKDAKAQGRKELLFFAPLRPCAFALFSLLVSQRNHRINLRRPPRGYEACRRGDYAQ